MVQRCEWAGADPLMMAYHDEEWGVPAHDDRRLFEFLVLEGAQAGLSWSTILRKREAYRAAFDGFDPVRVTAYDEAKVLELMGNVGIVRNGLKIRAAVRNARAFVDVQRQHGSFDTYIWQFVDGRPLQPRRATMRDVPATTSESDAMSKALKQLGFTFVGSTICYAFMQTVGMVNDHTVDCFRWHELMALDPGA